MALSGQDILATLHAKMFKQIETCKLVGVFDTNFIHSKSVASEYDIKAFENLDDLLNSVDAVSIAATTSSHYELVKKSLEKNKHVFVEKPITPTIAEAEEIVEIAETKNLNLQVGHIERFNPASYFSREIYN